MGNCDEFAKSEWAIAPQNSKMTLIENDCKNFWKRYSL